MALPTTISGTAGPTGPCFCGPFFEASNAWVFAPKSGSNGVLSCYTASDPTVSFSEIFGPPSYSGSADTAFRFWIGNYIGPTFPVIAVPSVGNAVYQFSQFTTDFGGSWNSLGGDKSPDIVDAGTSIYRACSIVARSSFDFVGAINGAHDSIHGNDYARIDMVRSTNGTSWTVADATNDTGSQVHYTGPVCVLGSSSRVHIFYKDDTNNTLKVSTLLSNNTWGSRNVQIDASIDAADFPIGRGVNDGGTIYVPYLDGDGNVSVVSFTSADTPSGFSITTGVSDVAPKVASNFLLAGLSLDGTDRHLAYIRSSDDDLARDVDTGTGWGTDTVERALASVTHLSANVIDR